MLVVKSQENQLNVAKMKMLYWMSGHTRQNRIKNECFRAKVEVASIMEKMAEPHHRWLRHVWRRPIEVSIWRVD